jgi:uncharacterized protein YdcH (DUF465 family)
MERTDRELLHIAMGSNVRLRRLYEEHCRLDEEVARYERRGYLTDQEKGELKRLKSRKLQGMDEMMQILRSSSDSSESPQP